MKHLLKTLCSLLYYSTSLLLYFACSTLFPPPYLLCLSPTRCTSYISKFPASPVRDMGDSKLFARSKSSELRAELDQAFKKSKPQARVKIVLKKIIANVVLNNPETANMMSDVIRLMRTDDIEIRKMCLQYLTVYASAKPKQAQEAIAFLSRFKDESDATLRALSIRTMSSIPTKDFVDLTSQSLRAALADRAPQVRREAAFAVSRLYQHDPDLTTSMNFLDGLNDLLHDPNSNVVTNALAALSYITEQGKTLSLSIDRNHSLTLILLLGKSNEWSQVYILNSLMSYVPQTEVEALELIELIIPSLQHENPGVALNAIKIIVYLTNYVRSPELVIPSLPTKLGSALSSLLSNPPEIQFLVLRNVILLLLGRQQLVNFDVEKFFCLYDDQIYVKDTKLEIIYLLANEDNVSLVLQELEEYATEVDVAMARKAIRAFGNLAIKLTSAADECVNIICSLVSNGVPYVVQEAVSVMKNILRRYPNRFDFAIDDVVRHHKLIDEPDAKTAFIWILGQYCTKIKNVGAVFEQVLANYTEDPAEVQYAILTAAAKLYLFGVDKGENILLSVLKWATEESNNPDIRDRGFFYWRLLTADTSLDEENFQKHTKQILLNPNPSISYDNENIDPTILEELELNIGSLASIYLKPVQHVFRMAKVKRLQPSPALQQRSSTPTPAQSASSTRSTTSSSTKAEPILRKMRSMSLQQALPNKPESPDDESTSFAKKLSRRASILTSLKVNKR